MIRPPIAGYAEAQRTAAALVLHLLADDLPAARRLLTDPPPALLLALAELAHAYAVATPGAENALRARIAEAAREDTP